MQVKSMTVSDYSSGTQYKYNSNTGNWQDIVAVGGKVNSGGSSNVASSAPAVTSVSSGQPIPFDSSHKGASHNTYNLSMGTHGKLHDHINGIVHQLSRSSEWLDGVKFRQSGAAKLGPCA